MEFARSSRRCRSSRSVAARARTRAWSTRSSRRTRSRARAWRTSSRRTATSRTACTPGPQHRSTDRRSTTNLTLRRIRFSSSRIRRRSALKKHEDDPKFKKSAFNDNAKYYFAQQCQVDQLDNISSSRRVQAGRSQVRGQRDTQHRASRRHLRALRHPKPLSAYNQVCGWDPHWQIGPFKPRILLPPILCNEWFWPSVAGGVVFFIVPAPGDAKWWFGMKGGAAAATILSLHYASTRRLL